ncbi:MAG: FtsX-like permease family protein [Desulfovibrionaceae bacterium]
MSQQHRTFALLWQACGLALKDYGHERLLSLCNILALAAVLTPLLVLYGVKFGVITTLSTRLLHNPQNMEISPVASGQYSPQFLQELAAMPQVAFVLPRTRALSSTMELLPPAAETAPKGPWKRTAVRVSLEPTAQGDPLVALYAPDSVNTENGTIGVILSFEAARKLGVSVGQKLEGRVDRLQQGKSQRVSLPLMVSAVLPLEAQQKDMAFVPLSLLEATEDYRDGRAVPAFKWAGETPPPLDSRLYPSFRLYARTLDDVAYLRDFFTQRRMEVYTRAEEIAAVQRLDSSLTLIFGLIGAAAAMGFVASTASATLAAVKRKERILGLIRLMGFPTGAIMLFPLFQMLLTALVGTGLAVGIYAGTATIINHLFASSLQQVEQICALTPLHLLIALGLVLFLSLIATLQPAARAARIEPSEVIRDV